MLRRVAECRRCHAEMIWCRTGRGKKMPVDAEPSSEGLFVLEGDEQNPLARRLPNDAAATYTGEKFTSHFATCPNADEFRQKQDRDAG